ncbi:MAG TPA: methyltransferase domain-containing protein [Bacteroidia bacterium]|jgi:ubiquinone/menaquinone biosynthesis C-methylase UbiE|nr:methyltransferase domain-containing protein [Bacteroidia bacterium]
MTNPELSIQEVNTREAFSRQAPHFDRMDTDNPILVWMRNRVRQHMLELLKPGDRILELNAGTGLDAVFFAQKEYQILATDLAPGMTASITKKVKALNLSRQIEVRNCSFNNLNDIPGTFDHIFSNFGGLNCAGDIQAVIRQFNPLLNKKGKVTLVMMPPVCPWELLLALKGNFKTAFRRMHRKGTVSHLEGVHFMTYYYPPRTVRHAFGKDFRMLACKGLGISVPPPYLDTFPAHYPVLFNNLCRLEDMLWNKSLFPALSDHYILSMEKTHEVF